MNRINLAKAFSVTRNSMTWGKSSSSKASWSKTIRNNSGPVVFAGILIVCSIAVGCSSDKPKPVSSNNPITQAPVPSTVATSSLLALTPEPAKPAPKRVVKKKPATVTYTDKTYGVSFEYPRKYAIETGDAAKDLLISSPVPMNFVQPGGVALAAVELPETGFANTDVSSAFFNVSVNNTLTADQCVQFSVPEPKLVTPRAQSTETSAQSAPAAPERQGTKLMLGDMELRGTEAVSGEGSRQSDSKYFHLFQNNACYEFELNVTTNASESAAGMKHVDRDRVFTRLEQILATVKVNAVSAPAPQVAASEPASPATAPESATNPAAQSASPEATTSNPAAAPDVTANAPAAKDAPATAATPAAPEASPQK